MLMSDVVSRAAKGDITAFAELYESVYKKMYCAAYYTLVTEAEAVEAVKIAADGVFSGMSSCKNQRDFEALFLKKLTDKIIAAFRSYRKSPAKEDGRANYIKTQMRRLTDVERLAVAYNALFDIDPGKISEITGLAEDVVSKKLESGQSKIADKL